MEITLNSLVIKEATKLKEFAFKTEIKRLDFKKLNPDNKLACIYGQMTGHCENLRANRLIVKSCERVFTKGNDNRNAFKGSKLNGAPTIEKRDDYFSPIEMFINKKENQKNGNNERLIQFLKGENKTLRFK